MANTTRFIFTDNYRNEPGGLKNGTGGSAPTRTEDAAFPMENAFDRDRSIVWASGAAAPDPMNVDYSFPGDRGVSWFALMNRRVPPGTNLTQYKAQYQTGAYNGAGVWTDLHTAVEVGSPSKRNAISFFNDTTFRSIRARLVGGGSWAVKLWSGGNANIIDTGRVHSPGGTETVIHPRTERETPEGTRFIFYHGIPYRRFALPFSVVSVTLFNQLKLAILEQRSFLYVDWNDDVFEVVVAPETALALLIASSPSTALRNVVLQLEEQP